MKKLQKKPRYSHSRNFLVLKYSKKWVEFDVAIFAYKSEIKALKPKFGNILGGLTPYLTHSYDRATVLLYTKCQKGC